MKIIFTKKKLVKFIQKEKDLGFIPTMGAIHQGHISLIKRSVALCNKSIVSIFINKPQFNRQKDYRSYPRELNKDISILRKCKVNYLYIPRYKEIYPRGPNKKIKINIFGKKLCGKFRPGHFEAVIDVVSRFIKIIKPKKIFFGQKDMQQLLLIEDFIKKNKIKTHVIRCKTIREKNGIALSSRNISLSPIEKKIASKVYALLYKKRKDLIKNEVSLKNVRKIILELGVRKIDYLEMLNVNKLIRPYEKNNKFKIFIAYYLRSTRLIDNI